MIEVAEKELMRERARAALAVIRTRHEAGGLVSTGAHTMSMVHALALLRYVEELEENLLARVQALKSLVPDPEDKDPEKFRREKPSCSTLPLTREEHDGLIDYGSAGNLIDRAKHHLDEALPTGQKRRGELALKLLLQGVDELRIWMRLRGYNV